MKKPLAIAALLLALFQISIGHAQEANGPQTGDAFMFRTNFSVSECDINGNKPTPAGTTDAAAPPTTADAIVSVPARSNFNIIGSNGDNYIISFWDWGNDANPRANGAESSKSKRDRLNYHGDTNRYFSIPKSRLDGITAPIYKRWTPTLGILTYPFKYRPQTGLFEKTFSLSITGGYNCLLYRTKPAQSISLTLGVGASSVTLNNKNTSDSTLLEGKDAAAATFSFNLIYVHDRLQIAVTCGIDKLIDGNSSNWNCDGRPWFAIGIGTNIFSPDKPSKQTEGDQP